MTFITLALIRQDLEMTKKAKPAGDEQEDEPQRQDLRERVAEGHDGPGAVPAATG